MYATEYPYAGLILPDASDLDPRPYLNAARRVLARLDPHPNGGTRLHPTENMVHGNVFGMRIDPQEDSDYGPRMVIEVVTSQGQPTEDEAAAQILSDTVLQALKVSPADIIEWYSPDVLLDVEDFVRLRSYVSPKRAPIQPMAQVVQEVAPLPEPAPLPQHESETLVLGDPMMERDVLNSLYHYDQEDVAEEPVEAPVYAVANEVESEAEKSRLSAASWLMAAMVAIVSLPVGVAMAIIGIYRGMEFRLVSQVLAVTVLFTVLYNTDRLNLVMRQFLH